MTTAALPLRIYNATIGDILDLALAQPHQVLLSTGSVALMAQFAAHGNIVDPLVGYCIAGGVEWAYLRGLASNAKAPTKWAAILNWSAFAIVVLWGVLWVATIYQAIDTAAAAWPLALAHVVPVAWLSLCAAMTHSAAAGVEAQERKEREQHEREREQRKQAATDALEVEMERERQRLALWAEGQRIKAALKVSQQVSQPATETAPSASHSGVTPDVDTIRRQSVDILTQEPDISVAELARRLNVSRAYLYKHKIGTKRP